MIDILTLTHSCGAHSLVGSSITSLRCAQNSFESQAIWPLFSMKLHDVESTGGRLNSVGFDLAGKIKCVYFQLLMQRCR